MANDYQSLGDRFDWIRAGVVWILQKIIPNKDERVMEAVKQLVHDNEECAFTAAAEEFLCETEEDETDEYDFSWESEEDDEYDFSCETEEDETDEYDFSCETEEDDD